MRWPWFGGLPLGTRNNYRLSTDDFMLPPQYAEVESLYSSSIGASFGLPGITTGAYVPAVLITPTITAGISIDGILGDGRDTLRGGNDNDVLFGGFDVDSLDGGSGNDYLDAGAGNDVFVVGGDGDDVIRGGAGDDVLSGGNGIDNLYGDDGEDRLSGDAGDAAGRQAGQRLFGGAGRDQLTAFAPPMESLAAYVTQNGLAGDQLFGGDDGDSLFGNARREVLVGDAGNDNLAGDVFVGLLTHAAAGLGTQADTHGANDILVGGSGEDQLSGGGGNDTIWGGSGSDLIDGQGGTDLQFGGEGIDMFVLRLLSADSAITDTINGHFGNSVQGDIADDNATDIVMAVGTTGNDTILIGANANNANQALVNFNNTNFRVNMRDTNGRLLVEQFRISGLAGNDTIGFYSSEAIQAGVIPPATTITPEFVELDTSFLSRRSRDYAGVFEGNSGNDTLLGSAGRDYLDGGRGSDTLYGFAGDDRLWGDTGNGARVDNDRLFAGAGNDDLIGGLGTNSLFAWSFDPGVPGDPQFGVFVDADGNLFNNDGGGTRKTENTGLNRMLGSERDDKLFGGTVVDFMYGSGGNNTLYRSNGMTFESLDEGLAGDEWKEFARESDQVWYISGTNAADKIDVNFVTERGLLSDHHLVTRLTDNNGNFTFTAQIRLDFDATDADGYPVWDADRLNFRVDELLANNDPAAREAELTKIATATRDATNEQLLASIIPPEGDFQVILIDALAGNDQVYVGPTVQKSVWVDGGAGDDIVEIAAGNAILVDKTESSRGGGLRGRNDIPSQAFGLTKVVGGQLQAFDGKVATADGVEFNGLTVDNPSDIDWYRFTLAANGTAAGRLQLASGSPIDALQLDIWPATAVGFEPGDRLNAGSFTTTGNASSISLSGLTAGTEYMLRVTTPNIVPTIYDLRFNLTGTTSSTALANIPKLNLGLRNDGSLRRDVILGGAGDDILRGGAGEDWIFGNDGNDVLIGGQDRQASDLMFGGPGDDTFQIIPDALPLLGNQPNTQFNPATQTMIPTYSDQFFGGAGTDRILFLGGDKDRRGFDVPDFAALQYNTLLHRYEFSALVWDIGTQSFRTTTPGGSVYQREFAYYQTRDVEQTQIELRAGNDAFHANPGFVFPGDSEPFGIDLGDFEQGATEAALTINGGFGDDRLYGGVLADTINGGPGNDHIVGHLGDDQLFGEGGNDRIFGNQPSIADAISTLPATFSKPSGFPVGAPSEKFIYQLAAPFLELLEVPRPGVSLNDIPDGLAAMPTPTVYLSFNDPADLGRDSSGLGNHATLTGVSVGDSWNDGSSAQLAAGASSIDLGAAGIDLGSSWTVSGWFKGMSDNAGFKTLFSSNGDTHVIASGNDLGVFLGGFQDSGVDLAPIRSADRWQHVAAVGSNGTTSFYIDGFLAGSVNAQVLASVRWIGSFGLGEQFAEQIDEVALFNQALDATQIAEMFASYPVGLATDDQATGLQGTAVNEQLSQFIQVGDFNGDLQTDYLVKGRDQSYVLFGPLGINNLDSIRDQANIIISHSAMGVPGDRFGDINGDGYADLVFLEDPALDAIQGPNSEIRIRIVFGGPTSGIGGTAGAPWPRAWDADFVSSFLVTLGPDSNSREIVLDGNRFADEGNRSLQVLEITADSMDDLLLTSNSSAGAAQDFSRDLFGAIITGVDIMAAQTSSVTVRSELYRGATVANLGESLVRRFSFNEESGTELKDSVGGASGTIVDQSASGNTSGGGGHRRNSGQIELFGGTNPQSDYIELPDNLLDGLTSATIEFWGAKQSFQALAPIFNFGPSTGEFLEVTWDLGTTSSQIRRRFQWKDTEDTLLNNVLFEPNSFHFALTIDEGAGVGGTTRVTLFNGGELVTSVDTTNTLAQLTGDNNWLGRSKDTNASFANALYNEFRVYNRVLTNAEIKDSERAGPDANLGGGTANSVVIGDVNGDGRDDVMLANGDRHSTFSANGVTASNSPILAEIPTVPRSVTLPGGVIVSGGNAAAQAFPLGDLNKDGFDDFALTASDNLRVYLGGLNVQSLLATPHLTITGVGLSATAGDYDGNGKGDLVVTGRELSSLSASTPALTYVFPNVTDIAPGTVMSIGSAPTVLTASGLERGFHGLEFDSSGQQVAFLPGSALNSLGNFSVSLWFKTNEAGNQVLINGAQTVDGGVFSDDRLTIKLVGGSAIEHIFNGVPVSTPTPFFNDGEYHHLTITRSVTTGQTVVWLDGVIQNVAQAGTGSPARAPLSVAENLLAIGNDLVTATQGLNAANRFSGELSDISIWSRALSTAEVRRMGDSPLVGNEAGLRSWYRMNESSGDTRLLDATVNGRHGTLGRNAEAASRPLRTMSFIPAELTLTTPYLDLNNDGVSDFVIAAPFAAGGASSAGRINFIYGQRTSQTIPDDFDVLENWSVAGSGSFVREVIPGQAVLFDLGGKPFEFAPGASERWFEFTTLGDGKAANHIRLNGPVRMDLLDAKGGVLQENQAAMSMRTLPAGTYYLRVFSPAVSAEAMANAFAIPLGNLFDDASTTRLQDAVVTDSYKAIAEASDLGVDRTRLGGASTFSLDNAGAIPFNFTNVGWQASSPAAPTNDAHRPGAGDISIRTTRGTNSVSSTSIVEEGIGIHANGLVTFDLNEIRTAGGYSPTQQFRLVIDKAGLNDFAGAGTIRNLVLVSSSNAVLSGFVNGQAMPIATTAGTSSFDGPIPAAQTFANPFTSYDLDIPADARYLSLAISGAGDEIFQDHGVFSGVRLIPLAFTIEMAAPQAGQTHAGTSYPDRDLIDGGDGDDILHGNHDLDRLFGRSGNDLVAGELVELRDAEASEILPVELIQATYSSQPPVLDPVVGNFSVTPFADDFESSTLDSARWTTTGAVVTSTQAGTRSANLDGQDTLTSTPIDLGGFTSATLTYSWLKGGTAEKPDPGDDLFLEVEGFVPNTWTVVDQLLGNSPDTNAFVSRTIQLPDSALRSAFRFRFRTDGDEVIGLSIDNWFVDNVSVAGVSQSRQLLAAVARSLGDPVTEGPSAGRNSLSFLSAQDIFPLVEVPFSASLNPNSFTVEFWAKPAANGTIVSTLGTTSPASGYRVSVTANQWLLTTGIGGGNTIQLGGPTADLNVWTHVAASFQASSGPDGNGVFQGTMNLYINGILSNSQAGAYRPNSTLPFTLAAMVNASGTPSLGFTGNIDEVRLWNSARSPQAIEQAFRSTVDPTSLGLEGYWRLDEGTGLIAGDLTVPANNGDLKSTFIIFPTWSSSTFEQVPVLHKPLTASRLASLTTLDASNRDLSDLSGAEFLVNAQSVNLAGNRLDTADLSNLLPRQLNTGAQANEQVGLSRLEELDLTGNKGITDIGQLVAFRNLQSLKLEGTQVDTNAINTARALESMRDLATLTLPTEILNPGQNLVTVEGQNTSIPFQVGVMNFGVEHTVTTSTQATDFGFNGNFTVSAWIFPTAQTGVVLAFGGAGSRLGLLNGRIHLRLGSNELVGQTSLALNQWHHVTWQYSVNQQIVYLNGIADRSQNFGQFLGGGTVGIGSGFGSFFNGRIDSIQVFNRALSITEIENNMFGGLDTSGPDVTANYQFNEGSGTVAVDSSVYKRNATLVSGVASLSFATDVAWTVTGAATAAGTSGPISFTANDDGIAAITVLGNRFPIVVKNINPFISQTPNLALANAGTGLREGQTITVSPPLVVGSTVEYNVLVDGVVVDKYSVTEPSAADRANMLAKISIISPDGQTTDLNSRGSASFNGTGFVETSLTFDPVTSPRTATFEGWVFPLASIGNRYVFDTAAADGSGWALYHNGTTWMIDTGTQQFATNQNVQLDTWQHLAVVFDADASGGQVRFYVNGIEVSVGATPLFDRNADGRLLIGSNSTGRQSFVGNIDEFRVWNRALTGSEVALLDNGPVLPSAPNLAGWWSFNESTGAIVKDLSLQANDARFRSVLVAERINAVSSSAPNRQAGRTVADDGLAILQPFENSTHSNGTGQPIDDQPFWHTAAAVDGNTFIEYDLGEGANFDLSEMLVWQYNRMPVGGDETNFGVKQYDLFVGTTSPATTPIIIDGQLSKAGGTDAEPAQVVSLDGLARNVRFVRIKIDSNFGGPFVGLGKVRFLGTPNLRSSITPPVYASTSYVVPDNGIYRLSASFDDGDGGTVAAETLVTAANAAPIISSLNPGNAPIAVGRAITFAPAVSDPGSEDTLTYAWDVVSSNGQRILGGSDATFAFTPEFSGVYTARLTVTDSDGDSSSIEQSFSVLPTVVITPPPAAQTGSLVITDAATSSPIAPAGGMQGTDLSVTRSYQWTVLRGTTTVATGTSSTISFVPTVSGNHTVSLTITDRFFNNGVLTATLAGSSTTPVAFVVGATPTVGIVAANETAAPDFDGVNDRISLTSSGAAPLDARANNFTFAAWIKPDTLTGIRRVIGTRNWSFGLSGNQLIFTTVGRQDYLLPATGVQIGVWTHVAAKFFANNSVEFFVDGQSIGTVTGTQPAATSSGVAAIGSAANPVAQFFDGMLRDVGVWGSVLTDGQLNAIRTGDVSGTNPVAYWQLDEASGTTVAGLTAAATGTLQSGLTWASHSTAQEGDTLTFTLRNLPPVSELATRTVTWTRTPAQPASVELPREDIETYILRVNADGVFQVNAVVVDTYTIPGSAPIVFTRTAFRAYVSVANAAPQIVADDVLGSENVPFTLTGRVIDAGISDTHNFSIAWSDNTSSSGSVGVDGVFSVNKVFAQDGVYTATITVTDNGNAASSAIVNVAISNTPPVAGNDSGVGLTTPENLVLTILESRLLSNDTDIGPNDTLSITGVSPLSSLGAPVNLNQTGPSLTYDPVAMPGFDALRQGQSATDTFTYTLEDGDGGISTGTVTVVVTGVNDLPIANVDQARLRADNSSATAIGNFLDNDSDVDEGTVLQVTRVNNSTATSIAGLYGSLTWNVNGMYSYLLNQTNPAVRRLAEGQSLTESFNYTVSDGVGNVVSTLTVAIDGSNDSPLALDNVATVAADQTVSVVSGGYDDIVLSQGAVAYWRMNDLAGTIAANRLAPSTPDGTIVGIPGFAVQGLVSNSPDNSLQLNGSQTISVGNSPLINTYTGTANARSISLWFKADNVQTRQVLYSQGTTATGLNLYIDAGELYFGTWNANTLGAVVKVPIAAHTPYQVVGVFGASTSTLYVNGTAVASNPSPFAAIAAHPGPSSTRGATLGGAASTRFHNGTGVNGSNFRGLLDEVALYNTALTAVQIATQFSSAGLLAGDTDVDSGDQLAIVAIHAIAGDERIAGTVGTLMKLPSGARLTVHVDGSYDYDPAGAFDALPVGATATDLFTYTAADSLGAQSTATVTLTIHGTNEAPSAVLLSGDSVFVSAVAGDVVGSLLAVDIDQGDTHTFQIIGTSPFGVSGRQLVVANPAGLIANQTYPVQVLATDAAGATISQAFVVTARPSPDATAPTSRIAPLPARAVDLNIPLTISGSDVGPSGSQVSGIREYRLFVSENAGEFVLFATLPANQLTTEFVATSNRNYFFRSVAVDEAGNVESKTGLDTQISVGDFDPPETNVVSAVANSLGLFNLIVTGKDTGGGRFSFFDVYVSVDEGVAQLIGTAGSGAPDALGNHTASIPYQGLTDGISHNYRFFSIGRDSAGNIEAFPRSRSSDINVTQAFASLGLRATGIEVQQGATQRSYIRTLEVLFSSEVGLNNLLLAGRVALERFAPNATNVSIGTGIAVADFTIDRVRDRLRLDFDVDGITSETGVTNPTNSPAGDGFYRVMIDMNGDGDFTDNGIDANFAFHRLLGDANGDGRVSGDSTTNTEDFSVIASQLNQSGENLDGDINGDGTVNGTDRFRVIQRRAANARLDEALIALLDD